MSNKTTGDTTMGADDVREAEVLRRSMAETRAHMGETIEELHGRLNPAVLKEEALEQFHDAKATIKAELVEAREALKQEIKAEIAEAKGALRDATIGKVENMVHNVQETVTETGESILDTLKRNPVPAAMAGVGLAWLFLGARNTPRRGYRPRRMGPQEHDYEGPSYSSRGGVGDTLHRVGDTIGNAAGDLAHSAQRAASSAAHGASDLVHQAKEVAGDMAQKAGESVAHLAEGASEQGTRQWAKLQETYRGNPLAVGIAVMAAGTAVGLAIPISSKERALMGTAHDKLKHKAEEAAHVALGKVDNATHKLAEKVTKAAENGGAPRPQM